MNRTYALVWNHCLGAWSVADEHARRRGKGAGAVLAAALLLPGLALAADLPAGGNIVSGSGQIGTPNGNQMVIDQASNKLAIDWQSFDIAAGHKVTFNQPGSQSIALNRVLGADGSKIMGQLDANGRVFIINPNGVLFGAGASVNVGGLVASTLDLSVSDFEAGNYQFKGNGSNASVINNGQITAADGGSIALLGGTVSNNGVIVANQGSVTLAAGNAMTLDFAGDGLLNVQVDEALVDALVENHQLIRADGGQVLLTANAGEALLQTVVNNTGVIEARTLGEKDGKIVLLGDFDGGTVQVAGSLDASAPNGGNGGFIDTSGAHVKVTDGAKVTTLAANGQTGVWLIAPTDFTVSAGSAAHTDSGIGAETLSNNLNSTSVILQTVAADNGTDKGDIHVNADITYIANQLTLSAHNAINLNAEINVNGSGTLAMNHGAGSINASFGESGGFKGKVNFAGSGAGLLTINGAGYTVIKDMAALQGMSAGNYALGGNLDASNVANFAPIVSFTGIFDGLGHTISGLTINRPGEEFVGLFGSIYNATLRNVGLEGGSVTGKYRVGGLVGLMSSSHGSRASISHAYATGAVTGSYDVGGLVGSSSSNSGSSNNSISHAYATGAVTGDYSVGGLVGSNSSSFDSSNSSISHAYATGAVTGTDAVGGLVGSNSSSFDSSNSSISHAYATGAVTGDYSVGGLVGSNSSSFDSSNSSISHAYATGAVTGDYIVGGLVGGNSTFNGSSTSITDSFWNTTTTGQGGSAGGGKGTTTAEMQLAATYDGWDFGSTWRIATTGAGTDGYAFYGLPTLQGVTRKTDYQYFDSGLGTEASPWALSNWQQLQNINAVIEQTTGKYFALNADLDKSSVGYHTLASATANSGTGWKPIGDGNTSTDDSRFTGTFKGQGHSIGDLVVNVTSPNWTAASGTSYTNAGLFGMATSAWIEQVGLINAKVSASGADTNRAGALVGAVSGSTTISQSYVSNANVTASGGNNSYAGGLLGHSTGLAATGRPNITKSYVSGGTVTALDGSQSNYAGGLVGSVAGGDIDQSYASTTVSAASANGGSIYAGGLTASLASGSFVSTATNSFWNSGLTSESKGGTGKTTAQLQDAATFAGWDIATEGGSNAVWRIYEGQTSPLLRGFLKQVTVTADASSITGKTYDGTTASVTASYTTSTPDAALDGSLSYATNSKNAGDYSTADNTLTMTQGLYSGQQGYDISYTDTDASLTIAQKALTVTGTNVAGREYNGSDAAAVTVGNVTGYVTGESLSVTATGTFDEKNAGDRTAEVTYTLTDGSGAASNYTLANTSDHTASIAQRILSIDGTAVSGRQYDGSTDATVTAGSLQNLVDGETLNVSASGTFDDKNAGNRTAEVTYTLTDGSGAASNYTLTNTSGHTAVISQKALTVSGTNVAGREYDGSQNVLNQTTQGTLTTGGVIDSDQVTLSLTSATLDSQNAGSRTATVAYELTGDDAGNYSVTDSTHSGVAISQKALTITANNASKTYDGQAFSGGNGVSYSGFVNGETEAVLGGALTYGGAAQGAVNAGTYGLSASGLSADNYTLSYTDGSLTVNKASLTVTANNASKTYDGQAFSGGNGVSYNGFVNGETETVLGGTLTYGGSAQGAVNAGTYGLSASGLSANNYDIQYEDGTLQVTAAAAAPPPPNANSTTLPYASVLASNGQTVSVESKQQAQEPEALSQDMLVTNPLDERMNLQVINHGIRLPEGI